MLIQALELDENNVDTLVALGRCYRYLDFPDKALACYDRVLESDPDNGNAYANKGTVYLFRQDDEEAVKCFEKGLLHTDKATEDYWIVYVQYAVAVARLGDPEKAEKMIKECEEHGYKYTKSARKMAGLHHSLFSKVGSLFSDL